jgi:uncharacterized delta-60 repeat protein
MGGVRLETGKVCVGVAVALGLVLRTTGSSFAAPGTLDPKFSHDCKVLVNFGQEPRDEIAYDVLVTGSGKIVLAGSVGRPAASSWALARLRPNGRLDQGFGGNGKVTRKVGEVGEARVIRGLGRGRILVGGSGDGAFAILAFTRGGRLDSAWGTDGIATFDVTAHSDRVLAIRKDGAGWLVAGLAGATSVSTGTPVITRFLDDGTRDVAFGVRTAAGFGGSPSAVKLTDDGGLIVAGWAPSNANFEQGYAVARYMAEALPDMTFAGGATVVTHFPNDNFPYGEEASRPRAIAVQPDGRILVGGETFGEGDYSRPTAARYQPDGDLDGRIIGGTTATTVASTTWRSRPTAESSPAAGTRARAAATGSPRIAISPTERPTPASATAACESCGSPTGAPQRDTRWRSPTPGSSSPAKAGARGEAGGPRSQ